MDTTDLFSSTAMRVPGAPWEACALSSSRTSSYRDLAERSSQRTSSDLMQHGGSSTDRVNTAVGLAVDRLWFDRPVVPDVEDEAEQAELLCTVDGYISNYFRNVAELSRESIYQAHQREILHRMREERMREDLMDSNRSGSMRELDEMIERVDLDDRSVQTEITQLMRIAAKDSRSQNSCRGLCPLEMGPCVYFPVGADDYPPVIRSDTANAARIGPTSIQSSAYTSLRREDGDRSAQPSVRQPHPISGGDTGVIGTGGGSSGKTMPSCQQHCLAQ